MPRSLRQISTTQFCNSGSEAVDTALKIALAYHNVRGNASRAAIGRTGARVSRRRIRRHCRRRHRQQPQAIRCAVRRCRPSDDDLQSREAGLQHRRHGMGRAPCRRSRSSCRLARCVHNRRRDCSWSPPPRAYCRRRRAIERLRAICDKHGILLIFDEVITGYGRLGYPFAAERYGILPDMITFAKGVTSGAVPMGGVIVRKGIYDAFMKGPSSR